MAKLLSSQRGEKMANVFIIVFMMGHTFAKLLAFINLLPLQSMKLVLIFTSF